MRLAYGVPQRRVQDTIGRQQRAADRAADLGSAGHAWPVAYWYLGDPRMPAGGLDDHLDWPAVGPLAHLQRFEYVVLYDAEWTQVGQLDSIEQAHQPRDQLVSDTLMQRHRAGRHSAAHSRAEHQVGRAIKNRREQPAQLSWNEAAVAIHKCQHITVGGGDAGGACIPVAAA